MSSSLRKVPIHLGRASRGSGRFPPLSLLRASTSPHIANFHIGRAISVPQVMFNPELPYVSIPAEDFDGHAFFLHRNIKASYPKKAHKVVAELNALFDKRRRELYGWSFLSTFSWLGWRLEGSCDAISRCFALNTKEDVVLVANDVLRLADELNHHPSVTVSGGGGAPWLLFITSMTHRPPGLSVKDPRLAQRIDEFVAALYAEQQEALNPHIAFLRKHAVALLHAENLTEPDDDGKSDLAYALTAEMVNVFGFMARVHPLFRDQFLNYVVSQLARDAVKDPVKLANFAARVSASNVEELEDILQTTHVEEKLQKALILLRREVKNGELQARSEGIETEVVKPHSTSSVAESQILETQLWHWQKNIGRAQPQLDVAEGDGTEVEEDGETSSVRGLNFWRLNNANDVQIFSEQKKDPAPSAIPTMRGLIP